MMVFTLNVNIARAGKPTDVETRLVPLRRFVVVYNLYFFTDGQAAAERGRSSRGKTSSLLIPTVVFGPPPEITGSVAFGVGLAALVLLCSCSFVIPLAQGDSGLVIGWASLASGSQRLVWTTHEDGQHAVLAWQKNRGKSTECDDSLFASSHLP